MAAAAELEERRWNRFSETMASFHAYFKQEYLTMHHTIEERHIFPILAKRMPEFSTETDDAHIASHKGIHKGLEELSTLVHKFKKEPSTYSPTEMQACLDSFRDVLFTHLDAEVNDLRGENMKKYWTLEELEAIPM
ncbi:hypothetical protein B0H19DRAFT_1056357 [Mycena capillaripes]|nr:hypothetical protein B0H19DRAFT_1056357 [Mycena capillaripes]